jgi:uroporphyrinogen-III decarboxylase
MISPDFQNTYEAAWLGCEVLFSGDQVPATHPGFVECPEKVMEGGVPDPFSGTLARGLEFFERYRERASRETFLGRPIEAMLPGWGYGTDGPMTVACNVFGAQFVCEALAADPDRVRVLLDFVTESIIQRITAWRTRFGHPIKRDGFIYADDSIALISTRMYKEHILPCHRRILDALATDVGRGIHLCGNATRHMRTIHEELNVNWFDTGFPVDFAWLRDQLGPEVTIQGGPHVDTVRFGSPENIRIESRRILQTGILEGGRFVLREGNNLAPGTPPENGEALYHAGWEHGLAGGRVKTPAIEWLERT